MVSASALSNDKLCDWEPAVRQLLSSSHQRWLQRITEQGQGKHPGVPQQQDPAGFLWAVLSLAISSGKVMSELNNWWRNFFHRFLCLLFASIWPLPCDTEFQTLTAICGEKYISSFFFLIHWLIPGAFLILLFVIKNNDFFFLINILTSATSYFMAVYHIPLQVSVLQV